MDRSPRRHRAHPGRGRRQPRGVWAMKLWLCLILPFRRAPAAPKPAEPAHVKPLVKAAVLNIVNTTRKLQP